MTTITTLDLRRKDITALAALVDAVDKVQVTHRGKPVFKLVAERGSSHEPIPGSAEAKKLFAQSMLEMRNSIKTPILDPNKSIKELYHEMLDTDPKYKPPYHR